MSNVEIILPRLRRCRPAGQGKWRACCPAHNGDNDSALLITDIHGQSEPDIHCFAYQCDRLEVYSAVGLSYKDFYPESYTIDKRSEDDLRIAIFEADVSAGKRPSSDDKKNYRDALHRVGAGERSSAPSEITR